MLRIVYPDARFSDDGDIERAMFGGRCGVDIRIFHEQPDSPSKNHEKLCPEEKTNR